MNEPKVAGTRPVVTELEAGAYWWCACGESKKQPYCDGSHKGTCFAPVKLELEQPKRVALCTCKWTANAPYCDGTHKGLA